VAVNDLIRRRHHANVVNWVGVIILARRKCSLILSIYTRLLQNINSIRDSANETIWIARLNQQFRVL